MKAVAAVLFQVFLLNQVWAMVAPNGLNPLTGFNTIPNPGNVILANEVLSPLGAVPTPIISNAQVTPIISEIVPTLQFGDITMSGDMPIGGTIKVRGCFPVYGMVAVDGNVPSAGTAYVSESFGNQVLDVVGKCARQILS